MNDSPEAATAATPVRSGVGSVSPPPTPADPVPVAPAQTRRSGVGLATGLAVAGLLGAGAAAWYADGRIERIEREFARRVQHLEASTQQREQQLKLLGDSLRDAQGKLALTEAKLADSLGQQLQLRQLYDEMARSRGELMLADVENSIMIAAQQLQLAGNVQSALLALQDAEQLLARSSQPALIGLRRVLTRDIERLKAVPLADFAAAVARLDALIAAIDQLPLLAEPPMPTTDDGAGAGATPRSGLLGLPERMARTGVQGWDAFVAELRGLFRVQRVDQPESLLLTPEQRYFARENLRLLLLHARLNLLARNEPLFRGDLGRATKTVERWFDAQHRTVAGALVTLRQLQSMPLAIDLPSLADSIAAVRTARASGDSR
jgi:uroporphyrin-3 C-methyltransferase/uroporphyrinogen III methyltransferase/synthase